MRAAYLSVPGLAGFQFIWSSLFIKPASLPGWLAPWTPSISAIRWSMQGNFISTYSDQVGDVTSGQTFVVLPSGYNTYNEFMILFGWGGKTKWYCIYMLLIYIAVVRILSFFALGISSTAMKGGRRVTQEE
jgi:hypothetical protein